MTLFAFLCFTVIFCALVIIATQQGGAEKVVPTILIVAEIYLLLLNAGIADAPISTSATVRSFLCAAVTVGAVVELLRLSDKTFALLAVFAGLQQFLASFGILKGVSL